jgi:folate-binding protein YgfZ
MNAEHTAGTHIHAGAEALNGVALLTPYGVIKVEGEDGAKFIHGQLTHDFSLLGLDQARLSAFCSPKGRMLASFIGFKRSGGEILLVCSRDVLAPTLKRLSMFVMRAKARLTDASAEFAIYGLAGNAIVNVATHADSTWAKADVGDASVVSLYPSLGQSRQLWVGPVSSPAPTGEPLSLDLWQWGEVRSGVATVTAPVVEAFVPQMLNYESIGGVSFKKGCYPGQEVVARSQFRGTLKRRAAIVHASSTLRVGDEIFGNEDPDQPIATVVGVADAPSGGFDAIISGQVPAMETQILHGGSVQGPVLHGLPLPYPLLDDI